jgi:hypothetical protein
MAIGLLTRLPEGIGAREYDAVTNQMDVANNPPEGCIFHSAGELEGRFQVFDVWESRELADRFIRDRLRPAQVAVVGEERLAQMPPAEVIEIALHNYMVAR